MSSDKRRRARVQGGWAAPCKQKTNEAHPEGGKARQPAWLGKTVDCPGPKAGPSPQKFVYEEPSEEIRVKPEVKDITKSGVYDISTGPSGPSRLRLFPNFIDPEECKWIYEQLSVELPWRQRSEGVSYLQPRLTAWFGDHPYSYSGLTHDANVEWTPLLRMLRDRLEEVTGFLFNSVLGNLYRNGKDHVPWHSDDEPSLRENPVIASLSFGDTRMFELRKKPPVEENNDYTYMEHIRVPLVAGTLLIMEGSTQVDWQHRIPIEYHDRGPRINLTFRMIYPES